MHSDLQGGSASSRTVQTGTYIVQRKSFRYGLQFTCQHYTMKSLALVAKHDLNLCKTATIKLTLHNNNSNYSTLQHT